MKILRILSREAVIPLLVGLLLPVAMRLVFGDVAQQYIGVLIMVNVIFVSVALFSLRQIHKQIEDRIVELGVTSVWIHEQQDVYKRAANILERAERKILVTNLYYPPNPLVTMPKDRPTYLTAIERVIDNKLKDGSHFVYKRILHSEKAGLEGAYFSADFIYEDPPQTFKHYQKICTALDKHPGHEVEVELFVCKPIHSFPSILCVDDRYFLLAMIAPRHGFDEEQHIELSGALFFEDHSGTKMAEFESMFDRVLAGSHRIKMAM